MQTKIRPCRGNFFSKLINMQTKIRPFTQDGIYVQGDFFFLKINKLACTSIRYTIVVTIEYKHVFFNGILPSLLKLQDWSSISRSSTFQQNFTSPIKMVEVEIPYLEALFFNRILPPLSKWQNLRFHTWKLYFFEQTLIRIHSFGIGCWIR